VNRGASITLAIHPLPVTGEIERLRREIDELSAFLSDRRAAGVENDIRLRHARIDSLLSSVTIPFNLLFAVRVWADTPTASPRRRSRCARPCRASTGPSSCR
jgi:hypothetical protein